MIKYTTICLVLCSSTLTAQSKRTSPDFNTWLSSQYQAINNPVQFVCTQACTQQYNSCLARFRFDRKLDKTARSVQCTSLWQSCYTKCVQGLINSYPDNTSGGGSSGGSSSGGSNGGDVITPPDTNPTDDETNTPSDPNQPPVL